MIMQMHIEQQLVWKLMCTTRPPMGACTAVVAASSGPAHVPPNQCYALRQTKRSGSRSARRKKEKAHTSNSFAQFVACILLFCQSSKENGVQTDGPDLLPLRTDSPICVGSGVVTKKAKRTCTTSSASFFVNAPLEASRSKKSAPMHPSTFMTCSEEHNQHYTVYVPIAAVKLLLRRTGTLT